MPRLTDHLDARLTDPVQPGRVTTDAGTLQWDADGVRLGDVGLGQPAVQLSREPVAPAAGWRRLWPWRRRARLLAELRSGTRRVRLAARVPPQQLDGLAELDLTAPMVMPGPRLLDLLHAVRAQDGHLIVDAVRAPREPLLVPDPVPEQDESPSEPDVEVDATAQTGPPDPVEPGLARLALLCWPLWVSGLPVVLMSAWSPTVVDALELSPWTLLALAAASYVLVPWPIGRIYDFLFGGLHLTAPARAGAAAGLGIACTSAGWALLGFGCWWASVTRSEVYTDLESFLVLNAGLGTTALFCWLVVRPRPRPRKARSGAALEAVLLLSCATLTPAVFWFILIVVHSAPATGADLATRRSAAPETPS